MRRINIKVDTLEEWYNTLIREKKLIKSTQSPEDWRSPLQNYHQQLQNIIKESDSYTEFGVFQGHTLAIALLMNPKRIRAYDIDLSWYYEHSAPLFNSYAEENKIDFITYEVDTSTCPIIDETDILHIDSLHTYEHCKKELARHGHRVKKYIIFHDTTARRGLFKALSEFIVPDWEIVVQNTKGVGYTLIKRK